MTIPAHSAIAIDVNALSGSWNVADSGATDVTFKETASTTTGTNVYVVGSIASLGGWSTSFEYRYIKKDSSGTVTWESGSNRTYTTGTSTGYTISDTWK